MWILKSLILAIFSERQANSLTTAIINYPNAVIATFFGYFLSLAFSGVTFNKKNLSFYIPCCLLCSLGMAFCVFIPNVILGWYLMPLVVHIPNLIILCVLCKKRFSTALTSICTAYLLCQPAKTLYSFFVSLLPDIYWLGLILFFLLFASSFVIFFFLGKTLSSIYNKEDRNVYIFGSIPILYYVSNYFLETATNFWTAPSPIVTEFFRFGISIVYLFFCIIYFHEYEEKMQLAYKEKIVEITLEQQQREIDMLHRTEQELRILRHDMRIFAEILKASIQTDDKASAMKLATNISDRVKKTQINRFCNNNIINYILSDYALRCQEHHIKFETSVKLAEFNLDEIMFASAISNALDNAYKANLQLPEKERYICLSLKNVDEKLVFSVKNPFNKPPVFVDGMPVSSKKGHGYGTQSISYITEKLNGSCMFSVTDKEFLLRIII